MNSVILAKSKLPIDFLEILENQFSSRVVEKILLGMCQKRYTTFRVNTLISNCDEVESELLKNNIKFQKINFINQFVYLVKNKNERDLQNLESYKEGKIYLQSISSMIPVEILNPTEEDIVLDLTAAPGSKTTQMACRMNNKGKIVANEIDKIRFERLKYNLNLQNIKNVEAINENGIYIGEKYIEKFDKVLIDAPCSGEGRFLIKNENTYNKWSLKMVNELSKLQRQLLKSAITACKKGGEIVYSTCTLNLDEDERIIDWAIKNFDLEILGIDLKIKNTIHGNKKGLDNRVEKTIKILPSNETEGFYIAKLLKR